MYKLDTLNGRWICFVKSVHMVKIDTSLFKVSKVCEDHILIRVDRVGGLNF
jgi:hypothetical protein